MKNLVRFAVAGALMAGAAAAHAQSQPSSGSADLWLFVSDVSKGQSFAEDTGISLSSILPTSSLVSGASLNTSVSANINLAASSALSTFLGSSSGDTLNWGVLGVQFPTNAAATKATTQAGAVLAIASEPAAQGANISQLVYSNLQTVAGDFQGDVTYLSSSYTSGGATYKYANGTPGGNVWGAATGANGGSTDLYGQGPDQSGIALGASTDLYGLTGNGNGSAKVTGTLQSYILGTNLTLSSNGTLSVSGTNITPPVPLPAAVWLFGSGLLGLLGVGRRRAATQA